MATQALPRIACAARAIWSGSRSSRKRWIAASELRQVLRATASIGSPASMRSCSKGAEGTRVCASLSLRSW